MKNDREAFRRKPYQMKHKLKFFLWMIVSAVVVCLAIVLTCNQVVVNNAKGKVYAEIDSISPTQWGLLLGTTPITRTGHRQNLFFKYRIDAAEQLFKAGKIDCLLISGDECSLEGINEPQCMKDSLVARGVPNEVIFLDGKGYRTLDSVVRMCKTFGVKSFTIISQRFHNERAIYLAEHLCPDIETLQAFDARSPHTDRAYITYVREYFARVKMFLDILANKKQF